MKINKIIRQCRRDFTAEYECDHCGFKEVSGGYDDANFHENVIPGFECKECGKRAGDDYRPLTTKYAEGFQI